MTYYINKDNSHNPAPSLPSNTIPTSSRTLQEPTSNIMSARGIIGGKKRKYMSIINKIHNTNYWVIR